ncbi:MAG: PEPxxWA-CTERM sorting domain-containing protein [Hyphomicrobiaceae bacterium]|nr:PEPxxWA-CTERM sorting domain-containing protein [Hyphomicrobiaceae bacterium]
MRTIALALAALAGLTTVATASPFTRTSPTGGALPAAVTEIGGVVMDLKGLNGVRVVTQAAASSLFVGYAPSNPFSFGAQGGFTPAVLGALGGGLSAASIRITLFDGDTASGNFDFNNNTFHVGSSFASAANFGNWSVVNTENTSSNGLTVFNTDVGFRNQDLSTGFFQTANAATLATLFGELQTGSVKFWINDVDPYDNYYDFTQGVDGGLINVGTGPVVVPGVPEPATWAMMLIGFAGLAFTTRRRKQVARAV